MQQRTSIILFFAFLLPAYLMAQPGSIKGKVFNAINNNPIPYANVVIQNTTTGSTSDIDGFFEIRNLQPGLYNLEVSYIGYGKRIVYEIQVGSLGPAIVNIGLEEKTDTIAEIEITAEPFNKTPESPLSMRTIGSAEIERNPGGNRDISKVIQSLPGVASTVSFRNDIIIRGGSPGENRFFLDGIEVPNINHFATQGSSGGPIGMINVNFIREVDFYSGAFPANRGNALSSVFDFRQKDGNENKVITALTLGSSDYGLTLDGPAGRKTTFIFSARRSYLGWLFRLLKLPFLPVYNDAQFKVRTRLDKKNELTFIGLGSYDEFKLNKSANKTEYQQYILGNIPVNTQWSYVCGGAWKHFRNHSYSNLVVSRNQLHNKAVKYYNNDKSNPDNLNLDYVSQEIENKLRFENTWRWEGGWKLNAGAGFENVLYLNSTYSKRSIPSGVILLDYSSRLTFNKYAVFIQAGKAFFNERLSLSAGLRTDFSDYSTRMLNPIQQLSPRIALSYSLTSRFSLNASAGTFFQLPPYTVLGYRDSQNTLINRENHINYISVNHAVAGLEYMTSVNSKFTLEGFCKFYRHYPFLTNDSVSLANLGGDYGIIGNEPATPVSEGRAYGLEFMAQQKLFKGFYGIAAYTLVRSEFKDKNGDFVPSTWDNIHIIAMTLGKKFRFNWEIGLKWRLQGGRPYTPVDQDRSSIKAVWNVTGKGIPDYSLLNSERLKSVHQLDLRIDKKLFFKKWTLNVYFDIQNVYGFTTEYEPILLLVKDSNGDPLDDPDDPSKYQTKFIDQTVRTFYETLGIVVEF